MDRRCGKGQHWTNEHISTRVRQDNSLPSGNTLRGLPQAPVSNLVQKFPVSTGETNQSPEQLKDLMPVMKNNTALKVLRGRTDAVDKTKI